MSSKKSLSSSSKSFFFILVIVFQAILNSFLLIELSRLTIRTTNNSSSTIATTTNAINILTSTFIPNDPPLPSVACDTTTITESATTELIATTEDSSKLIEYKNGTPALADDITENNGGVLTTANNATTVPPSADPDDTITSRTAIAEQEEDASASSSSSISIKNVTKTVATAPFTYTDWSQEEFPYRLVCPQHTINIPDGYDVMFVYHVGMMNNWAAIVRDQLRTLAECGLGKAASKVILSYSNGNVQEILDIFDEYPVVRKPDLIVESVSSPWEGPAINALHQTCIDISNRTNSNNSSNNDNDKENKEGQKQKKTIAFYFHNKGVSKYDPNWKNTGFQAYGKILYWRKYMEYFLIERPYLCIDALIAGEKKKDLNSSSFDDGSSNNDDAWACGVNFNPEPQRPHYGGNFWAATCDYISKELPPLDLNNTSYYGPEFWIGGRGHVYHRAPQKYVQLHHPKEKFESKNPGIRFNPYWHFISPDLYANDVASY